ncbi:MAG: ATP-dependent RNA helicase DbpA [Phycisphaerae bacterium]|nr:ATP-dependent RNA helicase DbpA [Phycisphaerae bacterium]
MNQTDFASLNLQADLLNTISSLGFEVMTPIQAQSLPPILAGQDVIGQAKSGSGKTAAFGLGLLNRLDITKCRVQSLVLCPTRELADQVSKVIRQLARTLPNVKILTLCGGLPFRPQASSLEHGAHIVVGTPGRVGKHLRKGLLSLTHLTTLVLDEGDRMLDMGFQDELDAIIEQAPTRRQTLLFSATYPEKIQSIAERIMIKPVMVKVASTHDSTSIEQHFYEVDQDERMSSLRRLLHHYRPESSVVFCATKIEAQEVSDALAYSGFSTLALHGDLEQGDRDETLVRFANKSVSILVATDVAARGLDIDSIDVVFNYHISRDFEVHVHRIGRTGRAGSKGLACSLYSEKERTKISELQAYLEQTLESEPLPPFPPLDTPKMEAAMATIKIGSGKKQKVRAGNILGALTGENGLEGTQVGKIHIFDHRSYVAVTRDAVPKALKKLGEEKWKGRPIQGWLIKN